MDFLEHARRRAFSLWLRTGRLPRLARGAAPERKYNPWHDPEDGRFTFEGRGKYFGQGSGGGPRSLDVGMSKRPREPFGGYGGGGRGFNGGGAQGSWDEPEAKPQPSSARGRPTRHTAEQTTSPPVTPRARAATDDPESWSHRESNGYSYRIDRLGRTRRVFGRLVFGPAQRRSPSAQTRAGGPNRRTGDEGGHYIARRFNGPTEAFNHFAQDRNFNRSDYSKLENAWARALRAGHTVQVSISSEYEGSSQRPSAIVVSYWIGGVRRRQRFPNEPQEKISGKR